MLIPTTETAEETEKRINTGATEETGKTGHDFVIKIENPRFQRYPRVTIPFPRLPRRLLSKPLAEFSWYG